MTFEVDRLPKPYNLAAMKSGTSLETVSLTIAEQLSGVEEVLRASIQNSSAPLIKEVTTYAIGSGGKRLRPILTICSSGICGHKGDDTIHLAAAIELIHTASLMHDDVLDGAELRRGHPAVNLKWGNHISVLVGDFCWGIASNLLTKHVSKDVLAAVTEAATKTIEGEVLEVVHNNDLATSKDTYMRIIELKTAHLISVSCGGAAILAEATPRLAEALKNYGFNLGMAFQITDDILDYTADTDRFGKQTGIDLKEGKLTLPIIYALERSSPTEKEAIKESLLAPRYTKEHFLKVAEILHKYDCINDAANAAKNYADRAKNELAPFKPSLEKETLLTLAGYVVGRRR